MWDESKQTRLNQLREAEVRGALAEAERDELAVLIEERCRYEEAATQEATRRTEEEQVNVEWNEPPASWDAIHALLEEINHPPENA
jgi:hypothetical protein